MAEYTCSNGYMALGITTVVCTAGGSWDNPSPVCGKYQRQFVNPLPNIPFWDCPKFKEAADDNGNMAIKGS